MINMFNLIFLFYLPHTFSLPFCCQLPFRCVLLRVFLLKRSCCSFVLRLSLVPGYSKLQIAADNTDGYWNMFDLLTHKTAPLFFSLALLLRSSPFSFSSSTKTAKSIISDPSDVEFKMKTTN